MGRAKTYERKRRRSPLMLALEERSPLRRFFGRGVEYDDGVDLLAMARFIHEFGSFLDALRVSPEWGHRVEMKFRRLGRHRAEGLYYPEQGVLLLDLKTSRSFGHEFGHLLDYHLYLDGSGPRAAVTLSGSPVFRRFQDRMLARMRASREGDARLRGKGGRASWTYYSSPTECFARAFEQLVAEALAESSILVRERLRYREDPFYFDAYPLELAAYFQSLLERGPAVTPESRGAGALVAADARLVAAR